MNSKSILTSRIILLLSTCSTVVSCNKETAAPASPALETSKAITEAKAWTTQHLPTLTNPTVTTVSNTVGYSTTEPVWTGALVKQTSTGKPYVQVALRYKVQMHRRLEVTDKSVGAYFLPAPQLLLTKDTTGHYQACVVEYLPDITYIKAHPGVLTMADFSGKLNYYDWQGTFLRGVVYDHGQPTKRLIPAVSKQVKSGSKLLRTEGYALRTHVVYEQSSDCTSGGNGPWQSGHIERVTRSVDTLDGDPEPSGEPSLGAWFESCEPWYTSAVHSYQEEYWTDDPDDPNGPNPNPPAPVVPTTSDASIISGGSYTIRPSSKLADILVPEINNQTNGAPVCQMAYQTGSMDQYWNIYYRGTDATTGKPYYSLSVGSARALTIANGSTANGAQAVASPIPNPNNSQSILQNQLFYFDLEPNGYYRITAKHSGKSLEISGGYLYEKANAGQGDYFGGPNQQWLVYW